MQRLVLLASPGRAEIYRQVRHEAIHDFTQRCTDVIEAYVRRYPELWLWMHRRWRAAPAPEGAGGPSETVMEDAGSDDADNAGSQDPAYR